MEKDCVIVPHARFGVPFHLGSIAFPQAISGEDDKGDSRARSGAAKPPVVNLVDEEESSDDDGGGPPQKGGGVATLQQKVKVSAPPTSSVPNPTPPTPLTPSGPAAAVLKNKSLYEWYCYLRPAHANQPCLSTIIEKVVFILGKGFANPIREVRHPPYMITEIGWANAHIDVQVFFRVDENGLQDRLVNGDGVGGMSIGTAGGVVSSQLGMGTQLGGASSGGVGSPVPKGVGGSFSFSNVMAAERNNTTNNNGEDSDVNDNDAVPAARVESIANDTARYGPFGKVVLHHEVKLQSMVPPKESQRILTAERVNKEKLTEILRLPEVGKAVVNERDDTFLFVSPPKFLYETWLKTRIAVAKHHAEEREGGTKKKQTQKKDGGGFQSHWAPVWPPLHDRLWNAVQTWRHENTDGLPCTPSTTPSSSSKNELSGPDTALAVLRRVRSELQAEQVELKDTLTSLEPALNETKSELFKILKAARSAVLSSKRKRSDDDVDDGNGEDDDRDEELRAYDSKIAAAAATALARAGGGGGNDTLQLSIPAASTFKLTSETSSKTNAESKKKATAKKTAVSTAPEEKKKTVAPPKKKAVGGEEAKAALPAKKKKTEEKKPVPSTSSTTPVPTTAVKPASKYSAAVVPPPSAPASSATKKMAVASAATVSSFLRPAPAVSTLVDKHDDHPKKATIGDVDDDLEDDALLLGKEAMNNTPHENVAVCDGSDGQNVPAVEEQDEFMML